MEVCGGRFLKKADYQCSLLTSDAFKTSRPVLLSRRKDLNDLVIVKIRPKHSLWRRMSRYGRRGSWEYIGTRPC